MMVVETSEGRRGSVGPQRSGKGCPAPKDTVCLASHNAKRFHLRSQQALENAAAQTRRAFRSFTGSDAHCRARLCQIAGRPAVTQRDSLVRLATSPPHPSGQPVQASLRAFLSHWRASPDAECEPASSRPAPKATERLTMLSVDSLRLPALSRLANAYSLGLRMGFLDDLPAGALNASGM
jgi:hypothetical protein